MPSPRNSRPPKPSPRASTLSKLIWTRSSAPRPQPPLASGRGGALAVSAAKPCCAPARLYRKFCREGLDVRSHSARSEGELEMLVTIEIPTAFRRFTEGAPRVDCSATTIAEALSELTSRFPALSRHVRDDQGQIRQFLNVYLNEEDIRFLGGESCALKEGDRVLLVPSIAGGY